MALKPESLSVVDIGVINMLCAQGLPGAEDNRIADYQATLDQWAQHVKSETDRNFHRFREAPAFYYKSEAFYKMLMMAVVVYEDFGIRYNPKWIASPSETRADDHFFADVHDVFIHGMVGPQRMGTCSSMPVFYIALGRRLGYPLKLAKTRQHFFMGWDSPTERFDMDATGKGMDRYDDDYYKKWRAGAAAAGGGFGMDGLIWRALFSATRESSSPTTRIRHPAMVHPIILGEITGSDGGVASTSSVAFPQCGQFAVSPMCSAKNMNAAPQCSQVPVMFFV